MTQEDKDLLLKDICARLPYGVVVYIDQHELKDGYSDHDTVKLTINDVHKIYGLIERDVTVKPYLFPMLSMTEEQKEEYYSLADDVTIKPGQGSYFGIKIHCIKLGISDNPHEGLWDWIDLDAIDWLNKNHFDYRGLIEKGLAINATGLNIY